MAKYAHNISRLSPVQRTALERELEKRRARAAMTQGIPRRSGAGPAPLALAQEPLWFLAQLQPDSPAYNIASASRLTGPLKADVLQRALNEVVRRHDTLRTACVVVEERPMQAIDRTSVVALGMIDLELLPPAQRAGRAQRLALEEARKPFDLTRAPLLRVSLLRLAPDDHVLVLILHHLVADGWSMGILFRELSVLYRAFADGEPSPLPELQVRYSDYACWQREWLQGELPQQQLAYWERQLAGAPALMALPMDRPRPAKQTMRGDSECFLLPPELAEVLSALGRQEKTTLFCVLLAAFDALLSRHTGQHDIVVGVPTANRTREEVEGLIGMFVNTLAIRTDASGTPTFRALLGRVREAALGALSNQDLPFEHVVQRLRPERSLSHTPIFQVMFALQNAPPGSLELPGVRTTPIDLKTGTAKFDLVLSMTQTESGLSGTFSYSADLFERDRILRMIAQFQNLLEGVAADPDCRISRLPLLDAAARQQQIVEWNATSAGFPLGCLHEMFEAEAAKTPNAPAVRCGDSRLTYAALNARANRLARHLRRQGIGRGQVVAIHLQRSLELVVGFLAVLKSGAAYLPLGTDSPAEHLRFLLVDSQAAALLSDHGIPEATNGTAARTICPSEECAAIAAESAENLQHYATPGDLAYVLYTSGSTGRPKGVMVEHRSLVNYLCWFNRLAADEPIPDLPAVTALTFDASLKQLAAPLLRGGEVWMFSHEATDPAALLRALVAGRPVGLNCVPSLWAALLDWVERGAASAPSTLTTLLLGGEQVAEDLLRRSWTLLPQLKIWNCYGPTEATANASVALLERGRTITIGRPVANAQVYVLNQALELQPVGVTGEIYIGGAGVARGYLNRPALTAEKFVPDPFSGVPGARLYRTGDLARYTAEGQIEFLGRVDDQVKIRGYRIEPGEVEACLRAYPGMRDAAVLALADASGDRSLVAYLVPGPGRPPAVSDLRAHVKSRLPEYMMPRAFVLLNQLPRGVHGKLDRHALPPPGLGPTDSPSAYEAPQTEIERALAAIFREVLGMERVGIHDGFFDLGGHSLLATQIMSRVREKLHVDVPLRALFQFPTIAGLGTAIEKIRNEKPEA
jgi:amino acid adenylation domain-containing protein